MQRDTIITYWAPLPQTPEMSDGGWGQPVFLTTKVFHGNIVATDPYILFQVGGYIRVGASIRETPLDDPFARKVLEISQFTDIRSLIKYNVAIIQD